MDAFIILSFLRFAACNLIIIFLKKRCNCSFYLIRKTLRYNLTSVWMMCISVTLPQRYSACFSMLRFNVVKCDRIIVLFENCCC